VAERNSSPAAAAGEAVNSINRDAAAVGCSVWFAGAASSRRRLRSAFSCIVQDNRLTYEITQLPVVVKSLFGTVEQNLGIHEPDRSALILSRINVDNAYIFGPCN